MGGTSSRISESIIENLSLTWQMYKEAINNIPDKEWRTGEIDYLIPARLVPRAQHYRPEIRLATGFRHSTYKVYTTRLQ